MMPEGVGSPKSEVRSGALNIDLLKLTGQKFFLKEFWHKKKSYLLVGNTI
jgi:hypothetical protein